MHTKIIQSAAFTTGGIVTLPVSGFGGIEITAVMEAGNDL
jgi:hypothetical protein